MPNQRALERRTETLSSPRSMSSPIRLGSRHSFLSSPSGSARRKSLNYASSFSNSHGVKPQKFIETGVSGA